MTEVGETSGEEKGTPSVGDWGKPPGMLILGYCMYPLYKWVGLGYLEMQEGMSTLTTHD